MSTVGLPRGWEYVESEEGNYYYNTVTEESQWEKPTAPASGVIGGRVRGTSRSKNDHLRFQSVIATKSSQDTVPEELSSDIPERKVQSLRLRAGSVNSSGAAPTSSKNASTLYESQTKYGLWASSMALFSLIYCVLFGIIVLSLWYVDSGRFDLSYYLVCVYAWIIALCVWLFEYFWGYEMVHGSVPWRAICYAVLSLPFFINELTALLGICFLFIAIANYLAHVNHENYTDEKGRKDPVKQWLKRTEVENAFGNDCCTRLRRQYVLDVQKNEFGETFFLVCFTVLNIYLWVDTYIIWTEILEDMPEDERLSDFAPYAKGFGTLLDLNCSLLVVPMLRTFIRGLYDGATRDQSNFSKFIRKTVLAFLPLQYNIDFHKMLAGLMFACAIGHTFFHGLNYANSPDQTDAKFGAWPWISGFAIFLCMFFIFSSSRPEVRTEHFEIFWVSHHFFILFYGLLLFHGAGGWNPNFWKWFVIPGWLYALERMLRYCRSKRNVKCVQAVMMQDGVFSLEFAKEGAFKDRYQEGQYVFVQCPSISGFEWHPFTISSAPSSKAVTLHIKVYGKESWTYKVRELFKMMGRKNETIIKLESIDSKTGVRYAGKVMGPDGNPLILIDGPHSAPTQHVGMFRNVMICGAGIGVTPVAATMKEIVFHTWSKSMGKCYPECAYFYWVCNYKQLDMFRWFILMISQANEEVEHMRRVSPESWKNRNFEVHVWVTSVPKDCKPVNPPPTSDVSFWGQSHGNEDEKKVQHKSQGWNAQDLYKTMKNPPKNGTSMGSINIYTGRPKWEPRFRAIHERHQQNNIGVTFCGAPVIAEQLKLFSYEFNRQRDKKKFKFYKENF